MVRKNITIPALTEQQIKNFWSKIQIKSEKECWLWEGYIGDNGYGLTSIRKSKAFVVHRVAYFLHYGIDPKELLVCHRCDVRNCCNPHHLFLGTDADNVRDMMNKGRDAFGKKAWSAQNPEHFAKLSADKVLQIREEIKTQSIAEISRKYKISYQTVYEIVHNVTWRHLPLCQRGKVDRIKTAARGENHGSKLHPERIARGERNGAFTHPEKVRKGIQIEHLVKLSEKQVIEIRSKYVPRIYGLKKLALEYGVTFTCIHNIISGKTWKHVG